MQPAVLLLLEHTICFVFSFFIEQVSVNSTEQSHVTSGRDIHSIIPFYYILIALIAFLAQFQDHPLAFLFYNRTKSTTRTAILSSSMCRGENVQCKECSRMSTRIVQLCIRGELMVNCPEIIIEGVNPEKEECRLCRYGSAKGTVTMPLSMLANTDNYDREVWRASKEQPMPKPIRRLQALKPQESSDSYSSSKNESESSSRPPSPEEHQLHRSVSTTLQSDPNQEMDPVDDTT
ncbi:unnamed protein product [Fusarium graminearum]|nr:unnamed protein product [Fusarium graminearum]CAF3645002.1 unnamed protein product [Fusarium graminearum]CAG1971014.1 unnamed protein product [Fusarium graminearum]VTO82230.1 unnamed protein product [Fusarium graminearum]